MRAVQDIKARLVKLQHARMALHSLLAFETLQTPHTNTGCGSESIDNLMRLRGVQTHLRLLEKKRGAHFAAIQAHVADLDMLIREHTESLQALHAVVQGPHGIYTTSTAGHH